METTLKLAIFAALFGGVIPIVAIAQPIQTNSLPPELQALTQSYTEMSSQMIYWRTQAISERMQIAELQRELDAEKKTTAIKPGH